MEYSVEANEPSAEFSRTELMLELWSDGASIDLVYREFYGEKLIGLWLLTISAFGDSSFLFIFFLIISKYVWCKFVYFFSFLNEMLLIN